MRKVAILGIGQTPVGEHWEKSLRELGGNACFAALADAGIQQADAIFVGNMLSPLVNGQNQLGAFLGDWIGMWTKEAIKLEAACGSGAAAFRAGLMAVASGEVDSALVVGMEKMTDKTSRDVTATLATAADADYEVDQGVSFVGLNALVMQRYMHDFGWKRADFADFSVQAHANASSNPNARLREQITAHMYESAAMVATPISLLDASPTGDGAAAIVLVPADYVRSANGRPKVVVSASAAATDTIAVQSRRDPLYLKAAAASAMQCYSMAGIQPKDLDLFELHDAFSIMAALSLEACGFADRGQAPRLALDGQTAIGGSIPISTRGGLKARGHPVGATGVYQIVEAVQQLRGVCGETQVMNARRAMVQNIGGSGATVLTHILESA